MMDPSILSRARTRSVFTRTRIAILREIIFFDFSTPGFPVCNVFGLKTGFVPCLASQGVGLGEIKGIHEELVLAFLLVRNDQMFLIPFRRERHWDISSIILNLRDNPTDNTRLKNS